MKQVVIHAGEVRVLDVPAPGVGARSILVQLEYSCVSAGTEVAAARAASEPLYRRALKHPEKARRALRMLREQGLGRTFDKVRGTTSVTPLGYSAAGTVIAIGAEVEGFRVGERVACAGAGVANHAEIVDVPVNLAVRIPAQVSAEDGATVALGAIALQGVRRAAPTLGESFVVVGLGLLGQLTLQALRANGCRAIGVDIEPHRVAVARAAGADHGIEAGAGSYVPEVLRLTDGIGADGVIIAAGASGSEAVNDALRACRRKGRVVLVGDVGLHLDRTHLYEKEIDVLVSTSYGPGRYDPLFEEHGLDYPLPYVRWTETRNMDAYLGLLAQGRVSLAPLPRSLFDVGEARAAYDALSGGGERPLLTLLHYPARANAAARRVPLSPRSRSSTQARVAVVGAGAFAQETHLPNLARLDKHFQIRAVVGRTGATATAVAARYGAAYATTDVAEVLADPETDVLLIATRHDSHARLALAALRAGKHVFVEKPLALTEAEVAAIETFYADRAARGEDVPLLMTGFNRRFSPAIRAAQRALEGRTSPLVVTYRMNAGYVPPEHWTQGAEGGGRNLGEACHAYDLFSALTRSTPVDVQAAGIAPRSAQWLRNDNFCATVRYADGSVCSLIYTALGSSAYPKERMEVYADGKILALDDYHSLTVIGSTDDGWRAGRADKGHLAEMEAFAHGVRTGEWPIPLDDQLAATRIALQVEEQVWK